MLRIIILTTQIFVTMDVGYSEAQELGAQKQVSRDAQSLSLEAIRGSVSARNALFQSLKFKLDIKGRDHPVRGGPWRQRVQAIDAVCDSRQHVKADMLVSPLLPNSGMTPTDAATRLHIVATRGAEDSRTFSLAKDGKTSIGSIDKIATIFWMIDPFQVLGLGSFNPAQYLDNPTRASIGGLEIINGEEAVSVKVYWEPEGYPGTAIGLNFWFCPSKGYALVQREQLYRPGAKLPMLVVERIHCAGFVQQGPLWLPTTAEAQYFHHDDKGYELDRELTATFSDWKVNIPILEKTFDIEFPEGTFVQDRIRNINYKKGMIKDPSIKGYVSRAKSLKAKLPASPQAPVDSSQAERFRTLSHDNRYPVESGWSWIGLTGVGCMFLAMAGVGLWLFARRLRAGVTL